MPSFLLIMHRFVRLCIPVQSTKGTFLILIILTFGRSPNVAMISSKLLPAPKKYGPLISYTSTPLGIVKCSRFPSIKSLFSSEGSISSFITLISVASATRLIKRRQAHTSPTSMAIVKSKNIVSRKVTHNTIMSLLGLCMIPMNERHPHIP